MVKVHYWKKWRHDDSVFLHSGNFDVEDASRNGRSFLRKLGKIIALAEQDRHVGSYNIVEGLNIYHRTVLDHLKKLTTKHLMFEYHKNWDNEIYSIIITFVKLHRNAIQLNHF